MKEEYPQLLLENQLCFPLYVCAKEITRRYKPFLDPLDLTYTQYITLLALWEYGECSVKQLGEWLYLDSGTLTPVLKKLEAKGYLTRSRTDSDERVVLIDLTPEGLALREKVAQVPAKVGSCVHLGEEDAETLYELLYKFLSGLGETNG